MSYFVPAYFDFEDDLDNYDDGHLEFETEQQAREYVDNRYFIAEDEYGIDTYMESSNYMDYIDVVLLKPDFQWFGNDSRIYESDTVKQRLTSEYHGRVMRFAMSRTGGDRLKQMEIAFNRLPKSVRECSPARV